VLKSQIIKVVAKDDGTLDGPAAGAVEMFLTLGSDTYCASFGGTTLKNQTGLVKRKDAAAPPDCGPPGPPICGNGVAEATSEECDDGGTSNGDGCDSACQLESTNPALCAGVPSTAGTALDSVLVQGGFRMPVHVTAPRLDPNRLFVVTQEGVIYIIKNGTLLGTPFLDLSDDVPDTISCCGEQGLLSMAFDPNYETNGFFYVSYTAPVDAYGGVPCPGQGGGGDNVVSRYQVSGNPDVADETSKVELLRVDQPYSNHNGGLIAFNEPPDTHLFFGVGDGGGADDPCESGQNALLRLGKLLRLNVTDTPPVTPDIWAIGLRNPWRWTFDRANGDLYIADVGQNQWEEVDYQAGPTVSGVDYQWDDMEARHCHEPMIGCLTDGTQPVLEYDHSQGCSITGGHVYRGCAMPDIQGRYFYSDICSGFIKSFSGVSGGNAQDLQDHTTDVDPGGGNSIGGVSSFGQDARGELYIVDYGSGGADGEVYKIVPGS
jgi:cysteine-rich repeat protein